MWNEVGTTKMISPPEVLFYVFMITVIGLLTLSLAVTLEIRETADSVLGTSFSECSPYSQVLEDAINQRILSEYLYGNKTIKI